MQNSLTQRLVNHWSSQVDATTRKARWHGLKAPGSLRKKLVTRNCNHSEQKYIKRLYSCSKRPRWMPWWMPWWMSFTGQRLKMRPVKTTASTRLFWSLFCCSPVTYSDSCLSYVKILNITPGHIILINVLHFSIHRLSTSLALLWQPTHVRSSA